MSLLNNLSFNYKKDKITTCLVVRDFFKFIVDSYILYMDAFNYRIKPY